MVSDSREGARQSEPSGIPHGQLVRVYFRGMHLLSRLAAPATPHCAAPCRMSSAARPAWHTRSAVRCLCSASVSDSCQLLEIQLCHATNRAQHMGECAFGNAASLPEQRMRFCADPSCLQSQLLAAAHARVLSCRRRWCRGTRTRGRQARSAAALRPTAPAASWAPARWRAG